MIKKQISNKKEMIKQLKEEYYNDFCVLVDSVKFGFIPYIYGSKEIALKNFERIAKVYIPAAAAGIISKESVAAIIPGIDMEEETERKEKRNKNEAEAARLEIERLKARPVIKPEEEEEGENVFAGREA